MTDELVWERLAISIWQYHSLLPRLHGEVIKNLAPALPGADLAGLRRRGRARRPEERPHPRRVGDELRGDPGVPAGQARHRASGGPRTCSPSSAWRCRGSCTRPSSPTEVVAYPLFLWAMLAMHRSITSPRWSNDLVALVVIVLAFFARTQFALLAGVLPLAVVAADLGAPRDGSWQTRTKAALEGLRPQPPDARLLLRAAPARGSRLPRDGGRPQPPQPLQQRGLTLDRVHRDSRLGDRTRRGPCVRDGDPPVRRRHGVAARRRRAALGGDAERARSPAWDRRRCW